MRDLHVLFWRHVLTVVLGIYVQDPQIPNLLLLNLPFSGETEVTLLLEKVPNVKTVKTI